jgi:hypothetical protein
MAGSVQPEWGKHGQKGEEHFNSGEKAGHVFGTRSWLNLLRVTRATLERMLGK